MAIDLSKSQKNTVLFEDICLS